MDDNTFYDRIAKDWSRIMINDSVSFMGIGEIPEKTKFPIVSAHNPYGNDYKVFKPEKINYEIILDKEQHHIVNVYDFRAKMHGLIQSDMRKLERAGIPIFITGNEEPELKETFRDVRFEASYSIPEELMYKSFFVLNELTPAVEKASEYAMQKVRKVLEKY